MAAKPTTKKATEKPAAKTEKAAAKPAATKSTKAKAGAKKK